MMKPTNELSLVYLCSQPVDFRKGILGLSALVEANLSLNPFTEALFVFCNRQRSGIKMLYWQHNGFCLWQKRLEQDRFPWPREPGEARSITSGQLTMLLDGIDFWQAHQERHYQNL